MEAIKIGGVFQQTSPLFNQQPAIERISTDLNSQSNLFNQTDSIELSPIGEDRRQGTLQTGETNLRSNKTVILRPNDIPPDNSSDSNLRTNKTVILRPNDIPPDDSSSFRSGSSSGLDLLA